MKAPAKTTRVLITVALFLTGYPTAKATLYTPPTLNPGDVYQLAFVTSAVHDAVSADIGVYNTFVQSVADAAGIGITEGVIWKAIASNHILPASLNAPVFGEIYDLQGRLIAHDETDLWDGSIARPLDTTETGTTASHLSDTLVWTGTATDGTGTAIIGTNAPYAGRLTSSNGNWIHHLSSHSWTEEHRFYALSEKLISPTSVSLPPTIALFTPALFVLVSLRKRKSILTR